MVPFTPRLIPAILPNLAHHVAMIQAAAIRTNKLLLGVIQALPSPVESLRLPTERQTSSRVLGSPTPTSSATTSRQSTVGNGSRGEVSSPESMVDNTQSTAPSKRSRRSTMETTPRAVSSQEMAPPSTIPNSEPSRSHSPVSFNSQTGQSIITIPQSQSPEEVDFFDYQATVNELTIQFLSEFEETRVAALKWLIMLHQKAPKKVCL